MHLSYWSIDYLHSKISFISTSRLVQLIENVGFFFLNDRLLFAVSGTFVFLSMRKEKVTVATPETKPASRKFYCESKRTREPVGGFIFSQRFEERYISRVALEAAGRCKKKRHFQF